MSAPLMCRHKALAPAPGSSNRHQESDFINSNHCKAVAPALCKIATLVLLVCRTSFHRHKAPAPASGSINRHQESYFIASHHCHIDNQIAMLQQEIVMLLAEKKKLVFYHVEIPVACQGPPRQSQPAQKLPMNPTDTSKDPQIMTLQHNTGKVREAAARPVVSTSEQSASISNATQTLNAAWCQCQCLVLLH